MNYSETKKEPSEAEKFRAFARQVISVPKAEIDRREAEFPYRAREWSAVPSARSVF